MGLRQFVFRLQNEGTTFNAIIKTLHKPQLTVKTVMKKYNGTSKIENQSHCGWPKKHSNTVRRAVVRDVMEKEALYFKSQ